MVVSRVDGCVHGHLFGDHSSLHHLPQVTSGQQFEDTLKGQLAEKREQVLDLESLLAALRGEVATLKGNLAASEDVSGCGGM